MAKRGPGRQKSRAKNKTSKKSLVSERIYEWSKLLAQAVNQAGGEATYALTREALIARTNRAFDGDCKVFNKVVDAAVEGGFLQYDDILGMLYTKYKKTLTLYFDKPLRKVEIAGTLGGITPDGVIFPMEVVSEYKDNMLKIDCGWEIHYGLDGFLDVTARRHSMMIRPDRIKKMVVE